MATEERTVLLKIEVDTNVLNRNVKDAQKNLDSLVPKLKKLKDENKQNTVEYKQTQVEIAKYNKELKDNLKAIDAASAGQKRGGDSLKDMKAQILAANIAFKSLSEEEKKGSVDGDKLASSIRNTAIALKNEEQALKSTTGALKQVATSGLSFEDQLKKINGIVKETPTNVLEMNKQIQAYQSLALQAGRTSPVGRQALKQAADLRDRYVDIQNETKRLADDQKNLKGVIEIGKGVVAGYGALQGAQALLGNESEELRKTFVKLQAAQTIMTSLDALRTSLQKESSAALLVNNIRTKAATTAQLVYNKVVGQSSGVMKGFKVAVLGSGIGAIIALIGLAITHWDELSAALNTTSAAQEAYNESTAKAIEAASEELSTIDRLQKKINDQASSRKEQVASIKQLQELYPDLLGSIDAETVSLDRLNNLIDLNSQLVLLNAQAQAVAELRAEEFKNQIQAQTDAATGANEGWSAWAIGLTNADLAQKVHTADQQESIKASKDQINVLDNLDNALQKHITTTQNLIALNAGRLDTDKQRERFAKIQDDRQKERQKNAEAALDLARKIRDTQLGNQELSLQNERGALEAHFQFLEQLAKGDATRLLEINQEKNDALRDLEDRELEQRRTAIEEDFKRQIEDAGKNKDLIAEIERQKQLELEAIDMEFKQRREQRDINTLLREQELQQQRVDAAEKAGDELALIEAKLALEQAQEGTQARLKAWENLQNERIRQVEIAAEKELSNTKLTAEERKRIEAQAELDILTIKQQTFEKEKQINEQRKQEQINLATSALSSAQQLSDALFQIAQNQLQQELNEAKAAHDAESQLLQDQLDAGIISQAEFNNKKATLDAEAAKKEADLKREQFKKQKAAQIINAVINTAVGVTAALGAGPPLGVVLAAVAAALGAAQIAIIASQPEPSFSKGGAPLEKSGVFGGKPHSSGGTKGVFDDGTRIEVERDEAFFVLNKSASGAINRLSEINQSIGGGAPLMRRGGSLKFQAGGAFAASVSATSENRQEQQNNIIAATRNAPRPVVLVEDINSAQGDLADVESRASF